MKISGALLGEIRHKQNSLLQKRAWEAFYRLIRRTTSFLRHMKQDKFVKLFLNFLKQEAENCVVEPIPSPPPSPTHTGTTFAKLGGKRLR